MLSSMAGTTKGLSFLNVSLFAKHAFGGDGPTRVLEGMSKEDQQALAGVVPVGWYDLELYARYIKQLVRVDGRGNLRLLVEYGRFSAEQDISKVYKLLFRITSPGMIFDQSMKLWHRFQDTGSWHVERGDRRASGILSDWGCVDEALCHELIGYLEALLAHGKCKQVRVEHPKCRAHGAPSCVFTCTWQ
jgi:hypothetical protein